MAGARRLSPRRFDALAGRAPVCQRARSTARTLLHEVHPSSWVRCGACQASLLCGTPRYRLPGAGHRRATPTDCHLGRDAGRRPPTARPRFVATARSVTPAQAARAWRSLSPEQAKRAVAPGGRMQTGFNECAPRLHGTTDVVVGQRSFCAQRDHRGRRLGPVPVLERALALSKLFTVHGFLPPPIRETRRSPTLRCWLIDDRTHQPRSVARIGRTAAPILQDGHGHVSVRT